LNQEGQGEFKYKIQAAFSE